MSTQLPPFDEHATCPKCGYNRRTANYRKAGTSIDHSLHTEYLLSACVRCGFEEPTACLSDTDADARRETLRGAPNVTPYAEEYFGQWWRYNPAVPMGAAGHCTGPFESREEALAFAVPPSPTEEPPCPTP